MAGLASLLEGYNSNLDNDDIRQIIRLSADDNIVPGHDNQYGYGQINAGRALEFLQEPYALRQWTATSGSVENNVGLYIMQFLGAPGLASANYFVRRYEVRKTVTFPEDFLDIIGVWGRGVSTNGWSMANPNFGEGFCEVVPGTLTETGVTLRTYVYEVYTTGLQLVGYYSTTSANVNFAYTVLGIPEPTLSGSDLICYSGSTYTIVDPPANTTITRGGTNVAYPYGNTGTSVTVRATSSTTSANGTVTASFSVNGIPYTITHPVWVGKPQIYAYGSHIVDVNTGMPVYDLCYGTHNDVEAVHPAGDAGITDWDWQVSYGQVYPYGMLDQYATIYPNDYQSFMLEIRACNTCGYSNWAHMYTNVVDCGRFLLVFTPNPTIGETTLSIESESEEKTFDNTAEWEMEIYNESQLLKEKKTGLSERGKHQNTNRWLEGRGLYGACKIQR